jgi:imidazolonepropionase-like amidohydrolase
MEHRKSFCLALAVTLFVLWVVTGHAQVIAIKAGKLVDPETGATTTNQIILIEGGKIKAIGAGLQIPTSASVIDLSNSTVLPGLFEAHAHMCQMTSPDNRPRFADQDVCFHDAREVVKD